MCHSVLYKQLSAWMLHGLLLEEQGEFFIEAVKEGTGPQTEVSIYHTTLLVQLCSSLGEGKWLLSYFYQSGTNQIIMSISYIEVGKSHEEQKTKLALPCNRLYATDYIQVLSVD